MSKLQHCQTLDGHKGRVWNAAWHPNGETVATCGEDKTIRIWQLENDRWSTKTILSDGHNRTIRSVTWSPCGQYLASASFDATIAIWDRKSGQFECNVTLEGHENEVKCVAWSKSGHLLASCSRDKSVWVWEVASEDELECAAVLNAHIQDVKKVVWHPNADILASASYDNTVKLYREDAADSDWVNTATLAGHTSTVWSVSFEAPQGNRLATASDDRTVRIWQSYLPGNPEGVHTEDNEATWKCVCTIAGYHSRAVYDVSWCPLTGLIATACGDDIIRVFKESAESKKNEAVFELVATQYQAHGQDVNTVAWNPRVPGTLISTSDDGEAKIWKYTTGEEEEQEA